MSTSSLCAIIGDDDYLVRQRAKEVFDEWSKDFPDDLSREIIDGRADRVDDVERLLTEAKAATTTLSLFGGGKLVWINEANFINQSKTGGSQGAKNALENTKGFLQNLGDSKLLLSACPVHRGHAFVKWLQKHSDFQDLSKGVKEDRAFRRIVEDTAQGIGCIIRHGVLSNIWRGRLVPTPGLGVEETRKLASYIGKEGGEITEQMIIDLVPDFGEG
jgi:DNA polymerase-3 subunit delta